MKRTKVSRVSAAGHGGAAALQVSQHERELARTAAEDRRHAAHMRIGLMRQKRVMENEFIFKQVTEREAFGPLGVMCEAKEVAWYWDVAKLLYNFIRDTVEFSFNFPGHMLVFQSVVDAQKALVKACPHEETEWTLWHVCLALEHRNRTSWDRGMQEIKHMIWQWEEESYDVDCSPLFMLLRDLSEDYADIQTPLCFKDWKMNDPVQVSLYKRLYVENVSDDDDKEIARLWELRHDVKKTLHALKTIAKL